MGGRRAYTGYAHSPHWGLVIAGGFHTSFLERPEYRHKTGTY